MRRIKVACVSDTHNRAHDFKGGIPPCHLVIHAGDITLEGEYDKLVKFDDWGAKIHLPQEQKICIAGNHEKTLEGNRETAEAVFHNWTYLQDELHEVLGLKIWGTPWSRAFGHGWAFQLHNDRAAEACWDMIPEDADIVVVHEPPLGCGDRNEEGFHVGCRKLYERLSVVKPMLTVCGHIHEDRGVFATPWGTVVNASIMTRGYKPKNKPIVVELILND